MRVPTDTCTPPGSSLPSFLVTEGNCHSHCLSQKFPTLNFLSTHNPKTYLSGMCNLTVDVQWPEGEGRQVSCKCCKQNSPHPHSENTALRVNSYTPTTVGPTLPDQVRGEGKIKQDTLLFLMPGKPWQGIKSIRLCPAWLVPGGDSSGTNQTGVPLRTKSCCSVNLSLEDHPCNIPATPYMVVGSICLYKMLHFLKT
jgi:hypothetical protein